MKLWDQVPVLPKKIKNKKITKIKKLSYF
jgi:hypothetical protein